MADRQKIENILLRAYALRQASDLDAILSLFAPNATYHVSGSEKASPVASRVFGQAELGVALKRILDNFDLIEYKILDLVIEDNRAAVRWTGKFRFRSTNEILESDIAHFWTVEDGKITALVEFCDTAHIFALLKGSVAG